MATRNKSQEYIMITSKEQRSRPQSDSFSSRANTGRILQQAKAGLKKDIRAERVAKVKSFGNLSGTLNKPIKRFDNSKSVKARSTGVKNLVGAFGAVPRSAGRGRPKGTYKYGIPIDQYKKSQSRRRALYEDYQNEQASRLSARGITPQALQQFEVQNQVQSEQPLSISSSVADDELQFQKFLAERTVSPNTQRILDNLKRTQNKAISDDINMQRIKREQRMVAEAGNLLKARNMFGPDSAKFNILDTTNNILTAPNAFKENRDNFILDTKGRPSILDTRSAGNSLFF